MARAKFWQDLLVAEVISSSGSSNVSLTQQLDEVQTRGMTVIRTIVDLHVAPAPPGGVTGTQQVSMAIGIVAQEAFAAGVLPDANSGSDRPARGWLWRTHCMVIDMPEGIPEIVHCGGDFRGKRKLDNGELFINMSNNGFQATAFSVNVIGIVRTLLLEG